MFKKQKIKSKSGITLVALVVTIVVLLILAGVSLNLVIGNDGIMKRAKEAKERYGQASKNEQKDLDTVEDYMNKMTGEGSGTGTGTVVKVNVGESATGVATINGKAGNTNNPTIPKGYTPINAGNATWGDGNSSPAPSSIDNGLVIKDDNNNEWVWVPVEEISKYYESVDSGVTITGSTVTTKKYTKSSIEMGREEDKTTITRGLPSSSNSCREPALLGTNYDSDANAKKAGFTDAKDMATKMVREYETMIKSIEKYGGFYIGRYELSGTVDNPTEKTGATITKKTWYELYNACKKIGAKSDGSDKEGIATRMIWECQWDATCDFISKKGDQKKITDSRSWGNYSDSTFPANTGNYEKSKKKDTGSNEYWKANNIYDIAGNCYEWTQGASVTSRRAERGGYYYDSGSYLPAYINSHNDPTNSYVFLRFSSHFNNYYWNLERGNQWKEEWNRLTENRI